MISGLAPFECEEKHWICCASVYRQDSPTRIRLFVRQSGVEVGGSWTVAAVTGASYHTLTSV